MSNVFDHLHLKQHTAGSSNELSFDVLDAARKGLDSKKQKSGSPAVFHPPTGASSALDTYHGTSGASTLAGAEEVERRKKQRRAHSARLWVGIILLMLVAIGVATYLGYGQYLKMQNFQDRYDGLVDSLVKADTCLPEMDTFMASPFDPSAEARGVLKQNIASSSESVKQVGQDAGRIRYLALTEADRAALDQMNNAITARLGMFDATSRTIEAVSSSVVESNEVNTVWNSVLDADQMARAATVSANAASTEEQVTNAKAETQKALDAFKTALQKMKGKAAENAEIDLSKHIAYLETRVQSLEYALATADALVEGDRTKAKTTNDLYNVKDKEAAALAEKLPRSLNDIVQACHSDEIETCKVSYKTARDEAIEADSVIRHYIDR